MPLDSKFSDYEPIFPSGSSGVADEAEPHEAWSSLKRRKTSEQNVESVTEETESSGVEWGQGGEKRKANEETGVRKEPLVPGHGLTYVGLFLFTAVLFFRPYELFPALSGLTSLAFWIGILTLAVYIPFQLGIEGSLTTRPREVNLVLLLGILGLLSIPLAISPSEAWFTFSDTFIRAVLIFIVIVNVTRTEKRLNGLLFLSLAVAFVLSIAAINDYRTGNFATQGIRIKGLIGGIFGNPNDLAIHLVTMYPLAIAFALGVRRLYIKVICGISAALFIAAIVATDSRGAFLALVGAGIFLTWKIGRGRRLGSMIVAGIVTLAFFAMSPASYVDRILSIFGMGSDPIGAASGEARKNLLKHSFYTAIRSPFGVGMGNYHIVAAHEAVSHNSYSQVASELGLIALVVYILFLFTPFKKLRQVEREALGNAAAKRFYYLSIGLQASIVAYIIGSFFGSIAYQWYVYYLVAYGVILHRLYAATFGLHEVPGRAKSIVKAEELRGASAKA